MADKRPEMASVKTEKRERIHRRKSHRGNHTVRPAGPLLVRRSAALIYADGTPISLECAPVALCRSGGTSIPPFCDGTHKKRKSPRTYPDVSEEW
jgi:CDGSH-type Zn-finger protein